MAAPKMADLVGMIETLTNRVEALENELAVLKAQPAKTAPAPARTETGCTIEVFGTPAQAMAAAKERATSTLAAKFKYRVIGDSLYVTPR